MHLSGQEVPDSHPSLNTISRIPQDNGVVIDGVGGGGGSSAVYRSPLQITNPGTRKWVDCPQSDSIGCYTFLGIYHLSTYGLPGGSGGGTAVMQHGGNPP